MIIEAAVDQSALNFSDLMLPEKYKKIRKKAIKIYPKYSAKKMTNASKILNCPAKLLKK